MFAVIFICENLFLRIAGKISKIRTAKFRATRYLSYLGIGREKYINFAQGKDSEVKSMKTYSRRVYLKNKYHYRT